MQVSQALLLATTHIRTFVAAQNETSVNEELVHVQKKKQHWELHYNLPTLVMPTSIPRDVNVASIPRDAIKATRFCG